MRASRGLWVTLLLASVQVPLVASAQDLQSKRCATRLSIAFLGKSPDAALLGSASPQSQVDTLVKSADFRERFARFVNASFNRDPGATAAEDSAYFLAKYVLENGKPWHELFDGPYRVDGTGTNITVTADPEGLGYFRSPAWLLRYAGNEESGLKLSTAYRIQNNVVGLKLVASTNAPGADLSATGRQAQGCRTCHYDSFFALDKVARVLTRRQGTGDNITFAAPPASDLPQNVLGGVNISSDKDLVAALVNSVNFKFATCRLAYQFLYARAESTGEGEIFDRCVDAFTAQGTIESALSSIAKDSSFCQ